MSKTRLVVETEPLDFLTGLNELKSHKTGGDRGSKTTFKSAVSLYRFQPCAVVHPTTEAEIIQTVQAAAQAHFKLRAIGSLHSAAPIPATEGVCIVLDQYKNLISIQGSLVTVQAGMKLWELNEILAKHNLALPVLGTIVQQTVSGAISTGTHGGSLSCKSLSGYVHALRLIRADGTVLRLDRSYDLFNAAVVSIGLLGIVSTVTFQCVPKFYLKSQICNLSMDSLLQNFDQIQRENQYVDMRYSPITDKVHLVLINSTSETKNGGWQPAAKSKLEWRLTESINKLAQRLFDTHRLNWLQRSCIEQYDQTIYSCPYGRSDFVLTHFDATSDDLITNGDRDDLDPVSDMEIAIPYSEATAALACIRTHFQTTQRYPSMHVHIRCSAADDLWLSPAYNQAICWLEFWEYPRTGQFFNEMIELLQPFHFRGHWGKQIPVEPAYLKKQYDRWDDFIQLRQCWDPDRMFANACLDHYFCL